MNHSDSTVNGLYVITPVDIHASLLQGPSMTNVVDNLRVLNISGFNRYPGSGVVLDCIDS